MSLSPASPPREPANIHSLPPSLWWPLPAGLALEAKSGVHLRGWFPGASQVPQEAQVTICRAHWCPRGRPSALQALERAAGLVSHCFALEPEPLFRSLRHRILSSYSFLGLSAGLAAPACCVSTPIRVSGAPPPRGRPSLAPQLGCYHIAKRPRPREAPCPVPRPPPLLSGGGTQCQSIGVRGLSSLRGGGWGQRMGTGFVLFCFVFKKNYMYIEGFDYH